MLKLLVFDNYDSFTYNLVHLAEKLLHTKVDVVKNDQLTLAQIGQYDKIILSPGPGLPKDAGILKPLIEAYASSKSILGVCLGHQAIGEVFGAQLINLKKVFHGVDTPITITDTQNKVFKNMEVRQVVGRYHSWVIDQHTLPKELKITAVDDSGIIMAISHCDYDINGVQFHPESILTPQGEKIISNWLFA